MSPARAWYRIALLVGVQLYVIEAIKVRRERAERAGSSPDEQPTPHVCQECDRPL